MAFEDSFLLIKFIDDNLSLWIPLDKKIARKMRFINFVSLLIKSIDDNLSIWTILDKKNCKKYEIYKHCLLTKFINYNLSI